MGHQLAAPSAAEKHDDKPTQELLQLIEKQARIIENQGQIIEDMKKELEALRQKLFGREKALFGRSSEKISDEDVRQSLLFNEAEFEYDKAEQQEKESVVKEHKRSSKGGRKKRSDPDETQEVVHDLSPEDKACPCCGKERPLMKQERSEEYDLVPAKVVRIVHLKNVYGSCHCEGFRNSNEKAVLTARGPAKIVKGSDFSNRSIALCIAAKYADGIPFYRVEKIYQRSGLEITRATLAKLTVRSSIAVSPVLEAMERDMLRSEVVLMDETTVQVHRIPGKKPTSKSYMWVRLGYFEGREIVIFLFRSSRAGKIPGNLLAGYTGHLQTDGYQGYSRIGDSPGIIHVGCMAHIRRKFIEAYEVMGKSSIALEFIVQLKELYAIESRLRQRIEEGKLKPDEFTALRAVKMAPVLEVLRTWLESRARTIPASNKLGQAISYALGQWTRASRFVDHHLLHPDTNLVENKIRPFVIGRNAFMFMDSPSGAVASAAYYSLLLTAKANGHDPVRYLHYLFDQLPARPAGACVDDLLPYRLSPGSY
jgi:transposase